MIAPLLVTSPKFDSDIKMNGLKSIDTNDKISKEFHQDSEKASMKIVFHSNKEDGLKDKTTKKDIEEEHKKEKDNIHLKFVILLFMICIKLSYEISDKTNCTNEYK